MEQRTSCFSALWIYDNDDYDFISKKGRYQSLFKKNVKNERI